MEIERKKKSAVEEGGGEPSSGSTTDKNIMHAQRAFASPFFKEIIPSTRGDRSQPELYDLDRSTSFTMVTKTTAADASPARIQTVMPAASRGTCFIVRHLIDL